MLHNFRFLFISLTASFFLIACDSVADNKSAGNQKLAEVIEISLTEEKEENTEATTLVGPSHSEETKNDSSASESIQLVEIEELNELSGETREELDVAIDPVTQRVIEEITDVIGIDKEAHHFIFNQTADYIELEIREKTVDGASPMMGRYRYMFDTSEILVMDYLTGEYVKYEVAE